MLQTPQAPPPDEAHAREPAPSLTETPPQQQTTPQPVSVTGAQGPYGYAPGYPAGYAPRYPMAPVSQASFLTPTGGQRLGLAIASLALLIPLFAIAINLMTDLMPYVAAGFAIAVGLIASALVCATVVVVNLLFNWDVISRKR